MTQQDTGAEAVRRQLVADATQAVSRAQAGMEAAALPEAARWIRRAHRLAPEDATVQILFGSITVHTQPDEAIRVLRALVQRLPWHREGAMALAAALLWAGRARDAAAALADMLHRMAPPGSAVFGQLAGDICRAAGEPGWVSLDGKGVASVTLLAPGAVRLLLDGEPAASVRARPERPMSRPLPQRWRQSCSLAASAGGRDLVGSGASPSRFAVLEGFVSASWDGAVSGWARIAADQDTAPRILLARPGRSPEPVALVPVPPGEAAGAGDDERPRWRFHLEASVAPASGPLRITGADGHDLWGSPVWPGAERDAARAAARAMADPSRPAVDRFRPLPASGLPTATRCRAVGAAASGCDVIVPVYAGLAELDRCLDSLAETLPAGARLVLVDDGSPDPAITARLAKAARPGVTLVVHDRPLGFPAAVNAGLAALGPGPVRDVVILNADTAVSGPWLERLSEAAHSDPAIGSCTPLTNDGTIVSYPEPGRASAMPDPATLAALNDACWEANHADAVAIPTGVGFCMLIKGACLAETGLFREDVFAQGYGEENDWCLRAAHLGWRHAAAPGVFVGHSGGRSFGAAKALLMERNTAVLERLHPGYGAYVTAFLADDTLRSARRRIDRLRLLREAVTSSVALVTHDAGGGVARHVERRGASLAADGRRPLILSPDENAPGVCHVAPGAGEDRGGLPNLRFTLPGELGALAELLRAAKVEAVEIHHLLHHHPDVTTLPALLGVPYDVYVHDYGHWCPRISLTGRGNRYCGEPLSPAECEECIADLGSRYDPSVTVLGLRQHSAKLLGLARRVAVSCEDVAARIRRQFPECRPVLVAWEDPSAPAPAPAGPDPVTVHVVVAGAIGVEKGFEVLLACARDAARRSLPLRFTVVGHTIDDDRLMASGCTFVTGRFDEPDGLALVREQGGTIGFVPSICPETWCFALSLLWQAGLPVLGFALGAQGERIGRSGRGWLLPPGLPAARVNDALVSRGAEAVHNTRNTMIGTR